GPRSGSDREAPGGRPEGDEGEQVARGAVPAAPPAVGGVAVEDEGGEGGLGGEEVGAEPVVLAELEDGVDEDLADVDLDPGAAGQPGTEELPGELGGALRLGRLRVEVDVHQTVTPRSRFFRRASATTRPRSRSAM